MGRYSLWQWKEENSGTSQCCKVDSNCVHRRSSASRNQVLGQIRKFLEKKCDGCTAASRSHCCMPFQRKSEDTTVHRNRDLSGCITLSQLRKALEKKCGRCTENSRSYFSEVQRKVEDECQTSQDTLYRPVCPEYNKPSEKKCGKCRETSRTPCCLNTQDQQKKCTRHTETSRNECCLWPEEIDVEIECQTNQDTPYSPICPEYNITSEKKCERCRETSRTPCCLSTQDQQNRCTRHTETSPNECCLWPREEREVEDECQKNQNNSYSSVCLEFNITSEKECGRCRETSRTPCCLSTQDQQKRCTRHTEASRNQCCLWPQEEREVEDKSQRIQETPYSQSFIRRKTHSENKCGRCRETSRTPCCLSTQDQQNRCTRHTETSPNECCLWPREEREAEDECQKNQNNSYSPICPEYNITSEKKCRRCRETSRTPCCLSTQDQQKRCTRHTEASRNQCCLWPQGKVRWMKSKETPSRQTCPQYKKTSYVKCERCLGTSQSQCCIESQDEQKNCMRHPETSRSECCLWPREESEMEDECQRNQETTHRQSYPRYKVNAEKRCRRCRETSRSECSLWHQVQDKCKSSKETLYRHYKAQRKKISGKKCRCRETSKSQCYLTSQDEMSIYAQRHKEKTRSQCCLWHQVQDKYKSSKETLYKHYKAQRKKISGKKFKCKENTKSQCCLWPPEEKKVEDKCKGNKETPQSEKCTEYKMPSKKRCEKYKEISQNQCCLWHKEEKKVQDKCKKDKTSGSEYIFQLKRLLGKPCERCLKSHICPLPEGEGYKRKKSTSNGQSCPQPKDYMEEECNREKSGSKKDLKRRRGECIIILILLIVVLSCLGFRQLQPQGLARFLCFPLPSWAPCCGPTLRHQLLSCTTYSRVPFTSEGQCTIPLLKFCRKLCKKKLDLYCVM